MTDAVLRSPRAVIDALRARKDELALANDTIEAIAGFAPGQANKYLGPVPDRDPTLTSLYMLLDALGLALQIVVDPEQEARVRGRWARRKDRVRDNGRLAKSAIVRARPIVLSELARKGAAARWKKASPEDRRAAVELMKLGREIKRISRAGTMEAA